MLVKSIFCFSKFAAPSESISSLAQKMSKFLHNVDDAKAIAISQVFSKNSRDKNVGKRKQINGRVQYYPKCLYFV